MIERIQKEEPKVEEVSDILDLEDQRREELLGLDKTQMNDVAQAVNRFPIIELQFEVQDPTSIRQGNTMTIAVQFTREMDEGERLGPVYAPHYPAEKPEGWWCIVANPKTNHLFAIKRLIVAKEQVSDVIEFDAPEAGHHDLFLYFVCDSYFGVDQEWEVAIDVGKPDK